MEGSGKKHVTQSNMKVETKICFELQNYSPQKSQKVREKKQKIKERERYMDREQEFGSVDTKIGQCSSPHVEPALYTAEHYK